MLNTDCIFCKIINGDIPSQKVFENEYCYAFRDINPQAPVHVLVVPKDHIESTDKIDFNNSYYVAKIFECIPRIARAEGLENGYRVVTNCGDDACQTVKHLHFHILGGEKLAEKMS
ncbi:MAG: histidine triad nucleotide-binding protein [Clostridia bacterium]|nr:histidine triad nucleotide-binding protein [Clostridia bacterium]